MILLQNTEHILAAAAQDAVKTAKFVEMKVIPALQKASANQQTIETITGLVSPQAANIERAAFAVLGKVLAAVDAGSQAAAAGGVNITIDAELVADIKAIAPAVQAAVATATPAPVAQGTMPDKSDLATTAMGSGAGAALLATVRWELVPHGEMAKILVAFALMAVGYLMYRRK
jgi:hypothetical protein